MTVVPTPATQLSVAWKPMPEAVARFGVNASMNDLTLLGTGADLGAGSIRGGGGWRDVENFDTGELSLPPKLRAGLELCAKRGVEPMMVTGYEPPTRKVGTCRVMQPGKAGDTVLYVSGLPELKLGYDCLNGPLGNLTRKSNYAGTYIVAATAEKVVLSAALEEDVAVGTLCQINRWRWLPVSGLDPNQETVQRYVYVARWLVEQALALGCKRVTICLGNEWEWPDSHFGNLHAMFDAPPATLVDNVGMRAQLTAALQGPRLPEGGHWSNGGTGKSGALSILKQFSWVTKDMVAGWVEDAHLYGNNPEHGSMDNEWKILNPQDARGNLSKMIHHLHTMREQGWDVWPVMNECGTGNLDDSIQARYDLRRILSAWPMGVMPWIFNVGWKGDMSLIEPGKPGDQPVLRPSGRAIARLRGIIDDLGGPGGNPNDCPYLAEFPAGPWPFASSAYYGASGMVLFMNQRNFGNNEAKRGSGQRWSEIPRPDPVAANVRVPAGQVTAAINLRTGSSVLGGVNDPLQLSVDDDPVAVTVSV